MRFTVVSLAMVTMLAGCEAARGVDDQLRRIDLLDRVFEPERFRPAPAPGPATRTQALLRQQPWLTRFWSELSPARQARVQRRLPGDSAARWDAMGLTDRVALLFGTNG